MRTAVNLAGIEMKNPVTVASGTFGYGREFSEFIDLNKLGGIVTKGTSLNLRAGNKPPRVCEVTSRNVKCNRTSKSRSRILYGKRLTMA